MPETLPEWLCFAFFTIGSLGGWALVSVLAIDFWRWLRKAAR